jgi:hypothetical protein
MVGAAGEPLVEAAAEIYGWREEEDEQCMI